MKKHITWPYWLALFCVLAIFAGCGGAGDGSGGGSNDKSSHSSTTESTSTDTRTSTTTNVTGSSGDRSPVVYNPGPGTVTIVIGQIDDSTGE